MIQDLKDKKWTGFSFFVLSFALIKSISANQVFTGDEPRYVYAGWSFFKYHSIRLDELNFVEWAKKYNFISPPADYLIGPHQVLHSKVLSPLIYLAGPQGGRYGAALIGLIGAFFLHRHLRLRFSQMVSTGVILCGYLSVPMLCYMTSLYAEIWLATIVAISWSLISEDEPRFFKLLIATSLIVWLPLFHMRALFIAVALFVILVIRMKKSNLKLSKITIWLLHSAISILITVNLLDYNSSLSAVSPSLKSAPFQFLAQLFSYRHGLLMFAPVYLLAFLGLIRGAVQRERLAIEALTLIGAGYAAFMWGNGLESDPSRFWIVVIPPLLLGLGYWFEGWKISNLGIVPLLLICWTACNSFLYISNPYVFLANRTESQSMDLLWSTLHKFGMPYLSTVIPGDDIDSPGFHDSNFHLMKLAFAFTLLVAVSAYLFRFSSRNLVKKVGLIVGVVLFGFLAVYFHGSKMDETEYTTRWAGNGVEASVLTIEMKRDHCVRAIAIKPVGIWWPPAYPREIEVWYFENGSRLKNSQFVRGSWNVEIPVPCDTKKFFIGIPRIEDIDLKIIER